MTLYALAETRDLQAELAYTPPPLRRRHLRRLEKLIFDVQPDRLYTYKYVFNRITQFHPDARGEVLLSGADLRHDMGLLLREMTLELPLFAVEQDDSVVSAHAIAVQCRVGLTTLRRWGTLGLALAHYIFPDGRRGLGSRKAAVSAFINLRQVRNAKKSRRLGDRERMEILEKARLLFAAGGISFSGVVRRIAEESGRAHATVRHLLLKREGAESRDATENEQRFGLASWEREQIALMYKNGISVAALSEKFSRSRPVVYRILHEALVKQALARKINYVPSPDFATSDAESSCLGSEGLFTFPPEPTEDMLAPPSGLPPYLADLYDMPLLKHEQEAFLFRKYNYIKYRAAMTQEKIRTTGYRAQLLERFEEFLRAADQVRLILIRCNLRLVVSIAKRHVGSLANLFELVSEGNVGLMRAVEGYDYRRAARFGTYATWAISKHFARVVPEENYHLATFVTGQSEMINAVGDYRPDPCERMEFIAHLKAIFARAAEHLTDRERQVIQSRYGTDGNPPRTLEELGRIFGLTRERVRQIESSALAKLRTALAPDVIEGLC